MRRPSIFGTIFNNSQNTAYSCLSLVRVSQTWVRKDSFGEYLLLGECLQTSLLQFRHDGHAIGQQCLNIAKGVHNTTEVAAMMHQQILYSPMTIRINDTTDSFDDILVFPGTQLQHGWSWPFSDGRILFIRSRMAGARHDETREREMRTKGAEVTKRLDCPFIPPPCVACQSVTCHKHVTGPRWRGSQNRGSQRIRKSESQNMVTLRVI